MLAEMLILALRVQRTVRTSNYLRAESDDVAGGRGLDVLLLHE
jgi:hypothetical protein